MAALLIKSLTYLLVGTYECLSYPCAACCECTSRIVCSPFTPYLFVTFGLNLPSIIWSYKSIAAVIEYRGACIEGAKSLYLWINGILAVSHLFGSIYIVYRIQQQQRNPVSAESDINHLHTSIQRIYSGGLTSFDNTSTTNRLPTKIRTKIDEENGTDYRKLDHEIMNSMKQLKKSAPMKSVASTIASLNPDREDMPEGQKVDDGPPSSFRRLGQVLCFDAGVAAYIVIAAVWMIWQSFGLFAAISSAGLDYNGGGLSGSSSGAGDDDVVAGDDDVAAISAFNVDCGNLKKWVIESIAFGFAYMTVVFFTFGCSLLCMR